MKKLFILLFLTSCVPGNIDYQTKNENLNFNDDLSFKEFKDLLIRYAEISSFPNIDE